MRTNAPTTKKAEAASKATMKTTTMILADMPAGVVDQAEAAADELGIDLAQWIAEAMESRLNSPAADAAAVYLPAAMVEKIRESTDKAGISVSEFASVILEDASDNADELIEALWDFA